MGAACNFCLIKEDGCPVQIYSDNNNYDVLVIIIPGSREKITVSVIHHLINVKQ